MTRNIIDYLENSANICPDKISIVEKEKSITYAGLWNQTQRIGTSLTEYNVFCKPVGVYMEKSIDALCSFFGIVSAGGFYCLLNTELTELRLIRIQEVLQAKVILTTKDLQKKAEQLFPDAIVRTVDVLEQKDIDTIELQKIRQKMIDTNPLYINFTSGSTGIPKGIVVSHRSVIDFIEYFTDIFNITSGDIIANQAPFDFDISAKDIYSAMKTGSTLVLIPGEYFFAPIKLIDYLCDHRVTTLIWAVSALCLITTFHALDYKTPDTIKKILFSGEVMPSGHLSQWQSHLPDATFVNLYGPTEITCNCTYHILEKGRDYSDGIPIGRHFPNEDVFLVDDQQQLITTSETVGDIIVRGSALALGYFRDSDKNAVSYIQNPLNDCYPEKVYITGDLGKYNDQGELVFCGRKDHQVKYMGHRIELEEIEKYMASIDGVDRCFCAFEKNRLEGYYVGSIEKNKLYAALDRMLPYFMIPGFIRKLDEIPLTQNGKIDRYNAQLSAEERKK